MRVEAGVVRVRRREAWCVWFTLTKAQTVMGVGTGFIMVASRGGEHRREDPGPKDTPATFPSGPSSGGNLVSGRVGGVLACPATSCTTTTTTTTTHSRYTRHALETFQGPDIAPGNSNTCRSEKKQEKDS